MEKFSKFAETIYKEKYAHIKNNGDKESWDEIVNRVVENVVSPIIPDIAPTISNYIANRKFIPGGRYLYASGLKFCQIANCFLLKAEDSREGWGDLLNRATLALMTGGGIGVVYSDIRGKGAIIDGMKGTASGPVSLMQMVNEVGRFVMQGGSRRAALWSGIHWDHSDVDDLIKIKNWKHEIRKLKETDFDQPAPLDRTNVSIILDDQFFSSYKNKLDKNHEKAQKVFWKTVKRMCKTGEPGFSIDAEENAGEHLRNACTEVTSSDDNDVCNLGSINLSRVSTKEEFRNIIHYAIGFLICGTLYSKVPYPKIEEIRNKNRRLGLGLMGLHEWLIRRGKRYGPDDALAEWLEIYKEQSIISAEYWANYLNVSVPVKTRAIAPTGTISIIAETTSGVEPIFCVAFKRRYLKKLKWHFQYVIDAAAKRLIDDGVDPSSIEDAYTLATDIERRLLFQAFVQNYVDHGISSTLNISSWQTEFNNKDCLNSLGNTFIKYLPYIRGMTVYPDAARGGQPLTSVPYDEACSKVGVEYLEYGNEHACVGGVCGI
jgi:ribonucleoside-diphosphate reductase alpha chain